MKLVDVLQDNLIKIPLQGDSKTGVIRELLTLLSSNNLIDGPDKVLAAVMERERIMTTGVGNGVAIPHCKTVHARNFAIAMGIHPAGVEFQSLDDKPAHIIFLLIGPDNKPGTHIRLLSRISRIISRKEVRKQILTSESPQKVYQLLQDEEANFFEINP